MLFGREGNGLKTWSIEMKYDWTSYSMTFHDCSFLSIYLSTVSQDHPPSNAWIRLNPFKSSIELVRLTRFLWVEAIQPSKAIQSHPKPSKAIQSHPSISTDLLLHVFPFFSLRNQPLDPFMDVQSGSGKCKLMSVAVASVLKSLETVSCCEPKLKIHPNSPEKKSTWLEHL